MKLISCFALLLFFGLTNISAAQPVIHVEDSTQLLPTEAAWKKSCETSLVDYERLTGTRILVQFHAKSPTEEEDKKPGAYMHALARKLGVDQSGVLVVYFNDDPDWRVWIGDELTNAFTGKGGTVQELTANEAIHNTKEAMLLATKAKADAEIDRVRKSIGADKEISLARRSVIHADALLEALKARLSAK